MNIIKKIAERIINNKFFVYLICLFKSEIIELDYPFINLESYSNDPKSSALQSNIDHINDKKYDLDIIVPVYNSENYLSACIDSILSQKTHFDIRVILVNDGSTDNSLNLIKSYSSDKRVIVINNENGGAASARNAGLDIINSKYVMFIDSDDYLCDKGIIEKCLCKINGYANKKTILQFGICGKHNKKTESGNAQDLFGMPWGKIYSSELFDGIRFPEKYWFEDSVCSFLIFPSSEKIILLPDGAYYYRNTPNSATNKSKSRNCKNLDTFYITRQLMLDREQLNLNNDKEYADKIMRQIVTNAVRLKNEPEKVQLEVFRCTCLLLKTHAISNSVSRRFKKLRNALSNNDYRKYKLLSNYLSL